MSRHEDIHTAIWADPDFEALSAEATLLYLWSWTNPRCGMAGIYKVSVRTMTESKLTEELVTVALAELDEAKFAFYETPLLWVRTRVKHLRARSPKMAISIVKDLRLLPPKHPLVVRFMDEYRHDPWLRDALAEPYREGIGRVSENPIDKGNSHTLSVPSPEGPWTGTGRVKGEDEGSGEKENPNQAGRVTLPTGFPEDRRPHLVAVFRVLRDLAARNPGAKAVNPVSLANVIMGRPPKAFVVAAHDYAAWADDQQQPRKDVVAGYRNWLDKTPDLASLERFDAAGSLIAGVRTNGNGYHSKSAAELVAEDAAARAARRAAA